MYQIARQLTSIQFLTFFLLGLFLIYLWYRRRETRGRLLALTALYVALLIPSLSAVSRLARNTLESQYPPLKQRPEDVQAIVVLSGGVGDGILRCTEAAKLYHEGSPCPVLITCSPDGPEFSTRLTMREYLLRMGVPPADILEDARSGNTYENALFSREVLDSRGLHKVIVVTDTMHLPRAVACFRAQGFDVVPAGCDYLKPKGKPTRFGFLLKFVPDVSNTIEAQYAVQEWLGMAWYRVCGRI